MSEHKCAAEIVAEGGWHHYPCSRKGKVQEGGKWWCHQHRPSAVEARRVAQHAKWDAERAEYYARLDADKEMRRRADCFDDLLAALELTAPAFHTTATKMGCLAADSFATCDTSGCVQARAAIAKAEEGP